MAKDKVMKAVILSLVFGVSLRWSIQAQPRGPWDSPLMMTWSTDGEVFATPLIFQHSSGVPCVVQWKGDTLAGVFQWFREPRVSPTWDRVAVKFSYDAGVTWTEPTPIVVTRPVIDPTVNFFKGIWHYSAPISAPQEGAYHAASENGFAFTPQASYPSDNDHPSTGFYIEVPCGS